jgi:hypothetical protein
VSAVTLVVVLLMMRALDDIRDLDYDRAHNPERPLARGVVRVRDLGLMMAVGTGFVLVLNSWRWPVAAVLAGQLAYAYLVLWADRRLRWPRGDAIASGFLVSFPVQLLVNAFLYAGLLYAAGLPPTWQGAAGIAATALAFLHLEFARKTTRSPRPGEHTYVTLFGANGTAALAVGCALASVAVLVATVRTGPVWLAVAPLAFVGVGALRFWRGGLDRWPYGQAALFMLVSFAGYQIINVVESVAA